jgi:hypothetical protein
LSGNALRKQGNTIKTSIPKVSERVERLAENQGRQIQRMTSDSGLRKRIEEISPGLVAKADKVK